MKTAFSTKENKSPDDVRSHWSLQKLMSSATRSLFVEASLLQVRWTQCADDERCAMPPEGIHHTTGRRARPLLPLSCLSCPVLPLSTPSTSVLPPAPKKAIGSILFAKYNLFQPTQVRSLLCLAFSVTQSVKPFCKPICTLFVTCISRPLPNQTELKLTTNSKLIEASASDVVLNWIELFVENAKSTFGFLCSNSRLVRNATFFIGPEFDRWLCLSLTNWLTNWLTNSVPFSKLDACGDFEDDA